jgi:hypothetical protein
MQGLAQTSLRSFREEVLGQHIRIFGSVAVAVAGCRIVENEKDVTFGVEMMLLVKEASDWRIIAQAWDTASKEKPLPIDLQNPADPQPFPTANRSPLFGGPAKLDEASEAAFHKEMEAGKAAFLREMENREKLYAGIPGGPELIAWFGEVPRFHDAEIVSLSINRRAPSILRIHNWATKFVEEPPSGLIFDRHAVVTFTLEDIVDLQLTSFSHQNVILGLLLTRAPDRPDRRPFYGAPSSPDDYELQLEPCYGLHGLIRCRKVSVSFTPGNPEDARP